MCRRRKASHASLGRPRTQSRTRSVRVFITSSGRNARADSATQRYESWALVAIYFIVTRPAQKASKS
jgi:hypothetical protein